MTFEGTLIDMTKVSTELSKAGIPDTVLGVKTTDILGIGAVVAAGLVAFVIGRKFLKRKRK